MCAKAAQNAKSSKIRADGSTVVWPCNGREEIPRKWTLGFNGQFCCMTSTKTYGRMAVSRNQCAAHLGLWPRVLREGQWQSVGQRLQDLPSTCFVLTLQCKKADLPDLNNVFSLCMIVSYSIRFLILCLHHLLLSIRAVMFICIFSLCWRDCAKVLRHFVPFNISPRSAPGKFISGAWRTVSGLFKLWLYLPYPYVMWKGWTPLHDALFVSWCFFHRSLLRILLFNDWDQMSGRVQQIGLTGQPTIETIPGGKPSVRSEIWVNGSAFFQLDTIIMSDRQFWFLLSSLNTVFAENFGWLWWWSVFCDVIFVGAIAVALRAQLLMELTCAYASAQSLPGNCRQIRKICKLGLWGSVGNSFFTSIFPTHLLPKWEHLKLPRESSQLESRLQAGGVGYASSHENTDMCFFRGLMVAMLSRNLTYTDIRSYS